TIGLRRYPRTVPNLPCQAESILLSRLREPESLADGGASANRPIRLDLRKYFVGRKTDGAEVLTVRVRVTGLKFPGHEKFVQQRQHAVPDCVLVQVGKELFYVPHDRPQADVVLRAFR